MSGLAPLAAMTRDLGIDRHPRFHPQGPTVPVRGIGSDLHDRSHELMTWNEWLGMNGGPDPARLIHVQIGAADAHRVDTDEHFACGRRFGFGIFSGLEPAQTAEMNGAHFAVSMRAAGIERKKIVEEMRSGWGR